MKKTTALSIISLVGLTLFFSCKRNTELKPNQSSLAEQSGSSIVPPQDPKVVPTPPQDPKVVPTPPQLLRSKLFTVEHVKYNNKQNVSPDLEMYFEIAIHEDKVVLQTNLCQWYFGPQVTCSVKTYSSSLSKEMLSSENINLEFTLVKNMDVCNWNQSWASNEQKTGTTCSWDPFNAVNSFTLSAKSTDLVLKGSPTLTKDFTYVGQTPSLNNFVMPTETKRQAVSIPTTWSFTMPLDGTAKQVPNYTAWPTSFTPSPKGLTDQNLLAYYDYIFNYSDDDDLPANLYTDLTP